MARFSKDDKAVYYAELEAYRDRLYDQIEAEAKKYGFTFGHVESAFRLSVKEKKDLSERWLGYYQKVGVAVWVDKKDPQEIYDEFFVLRPELPDVDDWGLYSEYLQVQKLLSYGANSTARL